MPKHRHPAERSAAIALIGLDEPSFEAKQPALLTTAGLFMPALLPNTKGAQMSR
jgi:hypothetical protein